MGTTCTVALVQTYTGAAGRSRQPGARNGVLRRVPCGGLFDNCWIRAIQNNRTTHCADLETTFSPENHILTAVLMSPARVTEPVAFTPEGAVSVSYNTLVSSPLSLTDAIGMSIQSLCRCYGTLNRTAIFNDSRKGFRISSGFLGDYRRS